MGLAKRRCVHSSGPVSAQITDVNNKRPSGKRARELHSLFQWYKHAYGIDRSSLLTALPPNEHRIAGRRLRKPVEPVHEAARAVGVSDVWFEKLQRRACWWLGGLKGAATPYEHMGDQALVDFIRTEQRAGRIRDPYRLAPLSTELEFRCCQGSRLLRNAQRKPAAVSAKKLRKPIVRVPERFVKLCEIFSGLPPAIKGAIMRKMTDLQATIIKTRGQSAKPLSLTEVGKLYDPPKHRQEIHTCERRLMDKLEGLINK